MKKVVFILMFPVGLFILFAFSLNVLASSHKSESEYSAGKCPGGGVRCWEFPYIYIKYVHPDVGRPGGGYVLPL